MHTDIPISGAILRREPLPDGQWALTCAAANIPDFGMILSKADKWITANQGDVTINCFYAQDKAVADWMLKSAGEVVEFYQHFYGFYPDNHLNLVVRNRPMSGPGGFPIGSNIVLVDDTLAQSEEKTLWAISHEIGHEYWGSNQLVGTPSWLCLGMGLWGDRQFMDSKHLQGQHSQMLSDLNLALREGQNSRLEDCTPQDMVNHMDDNSLGHAKGYCIAGMLEYVCGRPAMVEIAKTTLQTYAHKPLTTGQFAALCQKVTGQDLSWFFHQWAKTNDSLNYAIEECK